MDGESTFGPVMRQGNAAAGVGVMWKEEEVSIYPEPIGDEELAKPKEAGRVGEHTMSMGWDRDYMYM